MQNKTAYLNKEYFKHDCLWGLFETFDARQENKVYKVSPYITYLNQFAKEENKITTDWVFTDSEKVKQEFIQNKGNFTIEEIKNINFRLLYTSFHN